MDYPYGPYGQGYPGQPAHPPQAYPPQQPYPPQPQGYPPHGYPHPPLRPQPASPSGGTATAAGVLAALGTLPMLGFGVLLLMAVGSPDPEPAWGATTSRSSGAGDVIFVVAALAVFLAGILLAVGALTLWQRMMIGRWLVVAGCVIAILVSLLIVGALTTLMGNAVGYGVAVGYNGPLVLGLAFPIVTLVLALRPSTATWIRAGRGPIRRY